MLAVDLDIAAGSDDQEPSPRRKASHVPQHRHGSVVRPVQVVHDQQRRRPRRQRHEQLRRGVEQPRALFLRLQGHGFGNVGQPLQ